MLLPQVAGLSNSQGDVFEGLLFTRIYDGAVSMSLHLPSHTSVESQPTGKLIEVTYLNAGCMMTGSFENRGGHSCSDHGAMR